MNSCSLSLGETGESVPEPADEAPDARRDEDEEALRRFSLGRSDVCGPRNKVVVVPRSLDAFRLLKLPSRMTKKPCSDNQLLTIPKSPCEKPTKNVRLGLPKLKRALARSTHESRIANAYISDEVISEELCILVQPFLHLITLEVQVGHFVAISSRPGSILSHTRVMPNVMENWLPRGVA